MKHLEIEQLKKYGERRLNPEEMTQAVLHLDECGACFESFQTMFPALSDAAREVSLGDLTADDAEIFHLDYDEHLRPYIDYEADEVTREIVESHLENCQFCVRAVRELREFSDSLHLREDKKEDADEPTFSGALHHRPRRFTNGNFWRLSLPAIAVLILGIGGWLIWRPSATQTFVAENRTSQNAPQFTANENSFNRLPENSITNQEIKLRENDSANKNTNAVADKKRESNETKDELLLATLPPDFRARFQNTVRTQEINLPAFIADLREKSSLRGESNGEKNVIISPDAQAERSLRPTFRWRKFAAAGESYIVTIYDEKFNQISVSPNLRDTKWQSNVPLERGKFYKWQVKTATSSESFAARFKVLDANSAIRVRKIENAAPHSPLVRGVGYASEGLLNEAMREFQKEIVKNPGGNLAKKLKDSLRKRK
jgi:hypothetical protein